MRNKAKVEKIWADLSQEDQKFAALYGAKALANKEMFMRALNVHSFIKNGDYGDAGSNLAWLFILAVERKDFRNVRLFVDLLEEWNNDSVEIDEDNPWWGYTIPFAKDHVGMALLIHADVEVPIDLGPEALAEAEFNDEMPPHKLVRLEMINATARDILKFLKEKAPDFKCDIKTIRNRARELGVKLAPDKRGIRKGQKRKIVHRVQR